MRQVRCKECGKRHYQSGSMRVLMPDGKRYTICSTECLVAFRKRFN